MYTEILYDVDPPVATITLNRPESLNAWTTTFDLELRDALARATADTDVVGIVITGAGRAFSAGADMNLLNDIVGGRAGTSGIAGTSAGTAAGSGDSDPEVPGDFAGRLTYVMEVPKPVIAAVNGAVAGMSYPFALACDLRVASEHAMFVTSFAERGLIAEWGLSWLLPRLVGPSVALDLLFSSRRVGGAEAAALGLANHVVPADDLLGFCRRYLVGLAERCSPTSIAIMKRQVYQQLHRGLGVAEAEARGLMLDSFTRADFAEGVRSFLEKRSPSFQRLTGPPPR